MIESNEYVLFLSLVLGRDYKKREKVVMRIM